MRVKRYLLVAVLGGLLGLVGILQLSWEGPLVSKFYELVHWARPFDAPAWLTGSLWLGLGVFLLAQGIRWMNRSMLSALTDPDTVPEQVYIRRRLEAGPRIVALGGGTGLSRVLRGLKEETANLTAVVAVTDDGGSTGRLRDSFGIPAVGDLVDCLAALSDAPGLPDLMAYRFRRGGELAGHTFGNLMLVSLHEVEGNFAEALRNANQILRLRGAVWPATALPAKLCALREDGSTSEGETRLREGKSRIRRVWLEALHREPVRVAAEGFAEPGGAPGQPPELTAMPEALEAIRRADLIVLGPGSLYSSVIPSFLPPQIQEAILKAPGKLCYILNVMTEKGETDHLSALEHYRAIAAHLGRAPEIVVAHTQPIGAERQARYEAEGQQPVALDLEALEAQGVRVVKGDFLEDGPYAQHDPAKLVRALMGLRSQ
ncbi:gluconeogenesis factor YvcK family protein [Calidithermus chliarophilus]|uniref:gluconeogenesis factor YvcK family protein n=1 Tax=Calidithermus chliarophilus TaxID=52023 RepID=UPI0005666C65|nr:gluconeogenesis factor YvcK family protein [Calidithermus chliarophilus]